MSFLLSQTQFDEYCLFRTKNQPRVTIFLLIEVHVPMHQIMYVRVQHGLFSENDSIIKMDKQGTDGYI